MATFTDIQSSVEGLIGDPSWETLVGLPVYPSDYLGAVSSVPYLKFSIVSGRTDRYDYNGTRELIGLVIISIFTRAGEGQRPATVIADKLDLVFKDKKLNNSSVTLGISSLATIGADPEDNTLSRADYSVPLTYYGE